VPPSSPSSSPPPRRPAPVYTTQQMPPQPPMVIVTEPAPSPPAPEPPADSLYLAPVYTGIVVVDPPLHHHDRDRDRGRERDHRGNSPPAQVTVQPSSSSAEPPGDSVRKSALDTAAGRQSDDRSRPRQ
ncbi:MAG TPA: hypothetical protein VG672_18780, partial [Bryobacteraceae bacterium]|nr:hypothetical protein [Bryobacteraceae bacterium]